MIRKTVAQCITTGNYELNCVTGAGEESRTLDLNLGKVALYQLSYSRVHNSCVL